MPSPQPSPELLPRLAFVGPVLGVHPGWVTTQGEVLAGLFDAEGFAVRNSSSKIGPLRRSVDHGLDLLRWRHSVDVAVVSVFSGRAFALADEAISIAWAAGIPTVAWLHGGNLPDFGERHLRWTRRVLRRADAVVAPSAFLARWAERVRPDTRIIPNVLDLDAYPQRERASTAPRLLWMRTFQELYDPATAVRVLADLRGRDVDATLTMAGQDKGLLDATRLLADELGVGAAVSFPGFVTGAEKAALLDAHDVFLNTNLVDNAPVTVLEAAASGLVVVSTDAGGIPDLLTDDDSALLLPPGDHLALAAAAARVIADPSLASRLRISARAVAERSGWPGVRDGWLDLLGTIPQRRVTGSRG